VTLTHAIVGTHGVFDAHEVASVGHVTFHPQDNTCARGFSQYFSRNHLKPIPRDTPNDPGFAEIHVVVLGDMRFIGTRTQDDTDVLWSSRPTSVTQSDEITRVVFLSLEFHVKFLE